MSRLTLQLPEILHQQLAYLAEGEGVLLDQYIVYASTRQATRSHALRAVPEAEVKQQQQTFQLLIKQLGQASLAEIESVLATREQAEPEAELSADVVSRLKKQIQRQI